MRRTREILLVVSYFILVAVVVFQSIFVKNQWDDQQHNACAILRVNVRLVVAELSDVENPARHAALIARTNDVIHELNEACDGTDLPNVH